jgi:hypothetical protein
MGFFSAMFRILKTMAVGALMLPRIDHSLMPDGFQRLDQGNELVVRDWGGITVRPIVVYSTLVRVP